MKRAVNVSLSVMTAFYVAVAVSGYAVFGDTAANQFGVLIPDDILEGFPGPVWVVNLANALVLVGRRARGALLLLAISVRAAAAARRSWISQPPTQSPRPNPAPHDPGLPGLVPALLRLC
jgi:hypothetical protein